MKKSIFILLIIFLAGCGGSRSFLHHQISPTPFDVGSPPIFRPGYSGPFF